VDDTRFATARADALAARGYGDDGIRHLLEADGVATAAAEAAIAALAPERERAARLVARLGASAKTAAQLQRKGFTEDALDSALQGSFADGRPDT
jgi:SOS response regulatory protein OraA/RecX